MYFIKSHPSENHLLRNTREKREDTLKIQPQEVNVNVRIKKRDLAVPRDEIAAAVRNAACLVINLT